MSGIRAIKLRGGTYGIAAALVLCAIAFLALSAYLGLLNVVRPALAALLTAAGAAALAGVILASLHWSARRRARRKRQQAGNPIAGLEGVLARQVDPALIRWIQRHPDATVAATFALGIASGYSSSVRRTLEAVLEGLAEAERERGPDPPE
jgi:hypothetical protein